MAFQKMLKLGQPPFAQAVMDGLSAPVKRVALGELFDHVGALLFQAVEDLPDYGMVEAEQRLLRRYGPEMASEVDQRFDLAEASGSCCSASEWLLAASRAVDARCGRRPLLLCLPRGLSGVLDRASFAGFIRQLHAVLSPGDSFLFGADLAKDTGRVLAAYDDPTGVVAAFNKNLLARINRELGGHFNVRQFRHKVKWDAFLRRVELHLESVEAQEVYIGALGRRFQFAAGESIHTGSLYKTPEQELKEMGRAQGFSVVKTWIDVEWSFAEVLWRL